MRTIMYSMFFEKNSIIKFLGLIVITISIILFNCPSPALDEPVDAGGMSIQTMIVPEITNFPMGYEFTTTATPVHTVPLISSFKIGKFEVTYDQWYNIKKWASFNGYTFANLGREGKNGTEGNAPTITKNEPVTNINWRDIIIWCNAASQYFGLKPLYYTDAGFTIVLKVSTNNLTIDTTAGSEDNPYVDWSAKGYRLPTEAEWEAGARYQDGTTWTPGSHASGATADWTDATATGNVAWYSVNSGSTTHDVGTRNANHLGIYDMSGNVYEFCWDWYGDYTLSAPFTDSNPRGPSSGTSRIMRAGSWGIGAHVQQTSIRDAYTVHNKSIDIGFRIARNL